MAPGLGTAASGRGGRRGTRLRHAQSRAADLPRQHPLRPEVNDKELAKRVDASTDTRLAFAGMTAVVRVLIVQSGTVPGFTGLTSTNQIAVYGAVFGFAQEAVTRILEGRARAVQEAAEPTTAKPPPTT
jgi:hypothetical protein